MRFLLVFAVIILAGCSSSGGVIKLGSDAFTSSAAAAGVRGGSLGACNLALTEANEYYTQLGKEIFVTNIGHATINEYGVRRAEITFRCLAKGDPEHQRIVFRQTPDVTIEDRRK